MNRLAEEVKADGAGTTISKAGAAAGLNRGGLSESIRFAHQGARYDLGNRRKAT
jgi:hypothetical protein